jgi:hypothetical protein
MKQTAVEWIISQIVEDQTIKAKSMTEWINIFEQAKAMEKEKQKYFFDCGRQYQLTGENTFNEVYNETYGGNK